ncbi:cytochrome P450 [Syncephalis fuscata]|nr:cytochrome P450 [Syncephalis fuscata]
MTVLSTFVTPLLDILLDWKMVGIAAGAWLLGQIIYDDFISPNAKIPGMRPLILSKCMFFYYAIQGRLFHYMAEACQKYGSVCRIQPNIVCIDDPDAVRTICVSSRFIKDDIYKSFEFHGPNIFSTRDVGSHRKLKRTIGPVFSQTSVADLEPLIYETGVKHLVNKINDNAESGITFDIEELLHYTTLDTIGAIAFGESFNTLHTKPGEKPHPIIHWISHIGFLGFLKNTLGVLCNRWIFPKYFKSERQIIEFTRNAIFKRIARAEEDEKNGVANENNNDVLIRLINSEDPETGERLSVNQIVSESIIQLIGGTDTTALTMTWALHLLQQYPAVCQKLYEELEECIPDRTKVIHYSDVKNLTYLTAVLYETIRMYPAAGATFRKSPPGGIELSGVYIPEGYSIHTALLSIHFSTKIFGKDAGVFRPERWLDTDPEQLRIMRQSFLGFSIGSYACIGQNLAWMELRLLLSTLVRRFEFVVPPGEERHDPVYQFVIQPRGGCYKVKATHRAN